VCPGRMRRLTITLLLAAALAGCGGDDPVESRIGGDALSVYSSLPLNGPLAPVSRDIVAAEKLALYEAGGMVGDFKVAYTSLDSSDPKTGRWAPDRVAANARKAVEDRQTIAYLGELENGASAISLPILNEAGILQVSPRDTFGGLTGPGNRGEPEKYYPSGQRTFTRLVPGDQRQAEDLVAAMRDARVRRLVVADDRELAGTSMGDRVTRAAERAGVQVVDRLRLDAGDDVPDDLGRDVRRQRPDGFFYAGRYSDFALDVLDRVHAAAPRLRLYAPDDLAIAPQLAARTGPAADRLLLTAIAPPAGPSARTFARRFRAAYGREPDRQAILGYDAMRLVLRAIGDAGAEADSRRVVTTKALAALTAPPAGFARFRVDGNRLVPVG